MHSYQPFTFFFFTHPTCVSKAVSPQTERRGLAQNTLAIQLSVPGLYSESSGKPPCCVANTGKTARVQKAGGLMSKDSEGGRIGARC